MEEENKEQAVASIEIKQIDPSNPDANFESGYKYHVTIFFCDTSSEKYSTMRYDCASLAYKEAMNIIEEIKEKYLSYPDYIN